jgi:hypothetical protein
MGLGRRETRLETIIASAAKQSRGFRGNNGLLRRFTPRNDDGICWFVFQIMTRAN